MKPRLTAFSACALLAMAGFGAAACSAADFGKPKRTAAPAPKAVATPTVVTVSPSSFEGRLLATHNTERKRLRILALTWSPQLAAQAAVWAKHLATKGLFEHSQNRGNVGENLWMGTAGYFTPEQMIGSFIVERQYFRPGKFPDVSTTGKWADVGHYTQLIWSGTQQLGCARASGAGKDVLVCRYFPAGNVMGQRVP
jgi:hypothetical protein